MRHSLFGSDDEFDDAYDDSSQQSTRAPLHERADDGASRRHSEDPGTGKSTTLKHDEINPWRFHEQLACSTRQVNVIEYLYSIRVSFTV